MPQASSLKPPCTWPRSARRANWREAGCPARCADEIERYHAVCRACPRYGPDVPTYLAMATFWCPDGRWGDVVRPPQEPRTIPQLADRPPLLDVPNARRNLIYHVFASTANDDWRENVEEITRPARWAVFNGRRVVAIATGPGAEIHAPDTVRAAFPENTKFIEVPNHPRLREVASFRPLLETVRSTDPAEATFYAHTKGNSNLRDSREGIVAWRRTMYRVLLDQPQVVRQALRRYAAVGTTKMVWTPSVHLPPYPTRLRHGRWMLAGTFFWFRHDAIFRGPEWLSIPDDRYGAEAWLSGFLEPDDALSLYQPWPVEQYPCPNPYDPTNYE